MSLTYEPSSELLHISVDDQLFLSLVVWSDKWTALSGPLSIWTRQRGEPGFFSPQRWKMCTVHPASQLENSRSIQGGIAAVEQTRHTHDSQDQNLVLALALR